MAAAAWLSCPTLVQNLGTGRATVIDYWNAISQTPTAHPKGLKTAIILFSWELWKERNARAFSNKFSPPQVLAQKCKDEGRNWILAGAKHLGEMIG